MRKKRKFKPLQQLNIYFDCETYNQYDADNPKDLPFIVPYLIGVCTDEPGSYRVFIGSTAIDEFLCWLYQTAAGQKANLYAFNIDYDFQAIKPHLIEKFRTTRIQYRLTSHKKFIFGSIIDKTHKIDLKVKDLWVWDKTRSLRSYYEEISKLAKTESKWAAELLKYRIQTLQKETIDYTKKNMREENGEIIYEDENNITKTLNLKQELSYIKNDVIGLPLIRFYINEFKFLCVKTLDLDGKVNLTKMLSLPTLPGFAKFLFEAWKGTPLTEDYKYVTTRQDYYAQDNSYFGGFVAANKHKTKYLDIYKDNTPNIVSIDINSMYPWVMSLGLPIGQPVDCILDVPYATWYEGYFEKQITPGTLYRYKQKYDVFNNKFFGDGFFQYCEEAGSHTNRAYINKEIYDVFNQCCDHHFKITNTLYQALDFSISNFILRLYEIKRNPKNKEERSAVKLIMNSLYGKMAERFHEDYWEWDHSDMEYKRLCQINSDRNSILAGLYITSRSRARLISDIITEIDNGNEFLGCDTDSIKLIEHNPLKLSLDDDELGYWALEGRFTDFVHNQKKKKYLLLNRSESKDSNKHLKYACSGIPKAIIENLSDEDLITLFSEETDAIFPKIKNHSIRNKFFQICIKTVDVRFNYKKGRPVTHKYDKDLNKLLSYV